MNAQLKALGLTPAKAALIGVLVVAFAAVWGPQLIGGSSKKAARATATASPSPASRPQPAAPAAARADAQSAALTPNENDDDAFHRSLTEVADYDPFAAPDWSPAARRVSREIAAVDDTEAVADRFAAIRKSGVAMILVSGQNRAAQVGETTLQVGDVYDGFRVIRIDAAGVAFEPILDTAEDDLAP